MPPRSFSHPYPPAATTTHPQEAHETGVAMVIACPQEDAERYCESLRLNGLTSTIEPSRGGSP